MTLTEEVNIEKELARIVGAENVSTKTYELISYSRDASGYVGQRPDFVARPKTAEEIQEILRFANKYKIPVTPTGNRSGSWHAGSVAQTGGILLDLTLMKKIIIDENRMACTVEPGVTNWELQAELAKRGLRPPVIPSSTGAATIVGNAVTVGHSPARSGKYGWMADAVTGLEVVLPTGDIIRTGSFANPNSGDTAFFRYAYGPDLSGIFLGSEGAFGVVTKMSIYLQPIPEIAGKIVTYGFPDFEAAKKFVHEGQLGEHLWLSCAVGEFRPRPPIGRPEGMRERVPRFEDVDPTPDKRLIHRGLVPDPEKIGEGRYMMSRKMNEWMTARGFKAWVSCVIEGSKIIADAMEKESDIIVEKYGGAKYPEVRFEDPNPPEKFYFGSGFVTGGRLVAAFSFPPFEMTKISEIINRLRKKYGFESRSHAAGVNIRPVFPIDGFMRTHLYIDEKDPEEWERGQKYMAELFTECIKAGAVPYRLGTMVPPHLMNTAPEFFNLLKLIKKALDPNEIMHPGVLGLGT